MRRARSVGWHSRGSLRIGVAVAAIVLLPTPASAALPDCAVHDKQIFMRADTQISATKGTTNRIMLKDRTLDASCNALALSTAHINRAGDPTLMNFGDWVEIGWQRYRQDDGSVDLFVFTEWGNDFQFIDLNFYTTTPDYGNHDGWRVYWDASISAWKMETDLNDDGFFGTYDDTGNSISWNRGAALGETEKFGQDTGMSDDQRNLKYLKASNSTWTNWPGMYCIFDDVAEWEPNELTQTRYEVVQSADVCD